MKHLKTYKIFESVSGDLTDILLEINDETYWKAECWPESQIGKWVVIIKTVDEDEEYELEGQRPLLDTIVTIAKVLQDNGYKTGMVGKWGLGAPNTKSIPNNKGFDFFYGYNCQRQAHTLYPSHLWKNKERDILNNMIVDKGPLEKGLDPNNSESYKPYNQNDYAPTLMHDQALKFIDRNRDNKFFLYYASPLPHLPLQAPKKWVDYYREKLGEENPYLGDNGYYPNQYPKATYAGMISYLDEQVGEIVTKLKEIGKYENTIIVFTSDNGPTHVGQVDIDFFNRGISELLKSKSKADYSIVSIAKYNKGNCYILMSNNKLASENFLQSIDNILRHYDLDVF